jgi:hypothetical protein
MRYLVVLDARTPIGGIYASGSNDGFADDGELKHPILDCTEVTTDSPYLFAKRDRSEQGKSYHLVHIPHGCVVAVYCYADDDPKPIGFAPSNGTRS